jgi:hypothetical protein
MTPSSPLEKTDIPDRFRALFTRLVQQTQVAGRGLTRDTIDAYWSTLRDVPLDALAAGAVDLARTHVFFPTAAEWYAAAKAWLVDNPRVACEACADQGLIRVAYRDGEPFDLAVCTCRAGQWFRRAGEGFIRAQLKLDAAHQVTDLEYVIE